MLTYKCLNSLPITPTCFKLMFLGPEITLVIMKLNFETICLLLLSRLTSCLNLFQTPCCVVSVDLVLYWFTSQLMGDLYRINYEPLSFSLEVLEDVAIFMQSYCSEDYKHSKLHWWGKTTDKKNCSYHQYWSPSLYSVWLLLPFSPAQPSGLPPWMDSLWCLSRGILKPQWDSLIIFFSWYHR